MCRLDRSAVEHHREELARLHDEGHDYGTVLSANTFFESYVRDELLLKQPDIEMEEHKGSQFPVVNGDMKADYRSQLSAAKNRGLIDDDTFRVLDDVRYARNRSLYDDDRFSQPMVSADGSLTTQSCSTENTAYSEIIETYNDLSSAEYDDLSEHRQPGFEEQLYQSVVSDNPDPYRTAIIHDMMRGEPPAYGPAMALMWSDQTQQFLDSQYELKPVRNALSHKIASYTDLEDLENTVTTAYNIFQG